MPLHAPVHGFLPDLHETQRRDAAAQPGRRQQVQDDAPAPQAAPQGVELTVVVPTFKERDNVRELVRRLDLVLAGVRWEVIFVDDDSPDGTSEVVRRLSAQDARVRCLQRIGRRGLSSACVEGVLASASPFVAVMDADLQHDESILPAMLARLRGGGLDVVVGSRYVDGGGVGEWDEGRARISQWATRAGQLVVPAELKDPMSGFFMVRREAFMNSVRHLSSMGFKILVDLFASSPEPLRFAEVPYQFRTRVAGESKLDNQVAWDFLMLLLDKTIGKWVPIRFLSFAMIGGLGVFVHMATMVAVYETRLLGFTVAQTAATLVAMVFNFAVNNLLTYRDRQLKGARWFSGLLTFALVCSIGTVGNVGMASYLNSNMNTNWVLSSIAGILVGAVWNYAISSVYTWGDRKGA